MKIEILGKFYDQHSLAIINRYLALELSQYMDVCITPTDQFDSKYKIEKETLQELQKLQAVELENIDIQIRHTYPPIWRWPEKCENMKIVFLQHWEFSKVPLEWQNKWEQFADAIICSSSWTGERILDAGIHPDDLYAIPVGYNPAIFNTIDTGECALLPKDKFNITYVGCGQYRKGVDIVMESWVQTFVKADNVRLLIKDSPIIYGKNSLLFETIKMQYKTGCAEVIYNDDLLSEKEMANLFKNTDVLVHPFRGEGFGMHIQEAMACGAYPVVSGGGGPSEFVTNDCGMLISTKMGVINITDGNVMAAKPGDSFTGMGAHAWVLEPHKEDFAEKMRILYHHHERESVLQQVKNANLFTWADVGKLYKDALEKIHGYREKPKRYGNR